MQSSVQNLSRAELDALSTAERDALEVQLKERLAHQASLHAQQIDEGKVVEDERDQSAQEGLPRVDRLLELLGQNDDLKGESTRVVRMLSLGRTT